MKRKLALTILVILLLAAICLQLVGCNNSGPQLEPHSAGAVYSYGDFEPAHEKAILFLPGLMASALYSNDTKNTNTWGYGFFFSAVAELLSAAGNKNYTMDDKRAALDAILKKFTCDENSVPYTKQRVANMYDEYCYDAFDGMLYSYEVLEPYYKNTHDLVVWQYDWRQSVTGAAEELENFINKYNYKEVCFVTHSLGGSVVAQYLARSEENRDKTALFVPFAAPFFGSYDAVTYLFDEQHEEGYKAPSLDDYNMTEIITELFSGNAPDTNPIDLGTAIVNNLMGSEIALTDITRNMASVYQMLPNATALSSTPFYDSASAEYVGVSSPYTLSGKETKKNKALIKYLDTLTWTHRSSDSEIKPAVNSLSDYYSSLFIKTGFNEYTFVTELVTTEYIVGIGCDTTVGVVLDEKGQIVKTITSELGDYTIPAYSASAGLPLDHERVHTVDKSHNYIANNTADHPANETGIQFLLEIFERNIGY